MPHINDKMDYTVEVFVVYGGRVLLRKHDKYKLWLSVGGHIEPGEDPNEAAIREVKEEVGLEVKLVSPEYSMRSDGSYLDLIPPVFLNRHRINETHEHVTLVYFATSDTDKIRQGKTEISDECKWWTKEELEKSEELKDDIRRYALAALDKA